MAAPELGRVRPEEFAAAQSAELDWWRNKPLAEAYTEALWRRLGFARTQFRGLRVMDLGCGPTLHAAWFEGLAELIAVDPLAEQYRAEVPWHRLDRASRVVAQPAERLVKGVELQLDVVLSINALDHAYDLAASIWNVAEYLKPGGLAFLSFDIHGRGDRLHPMVLTAEYCEERYRLEGLAVHRRAVGVRGWLDPLCDARGAYGGGLAHHWWLQKGPRP
jgi:SAM-dependent methyltransferase